MKITINLELALNGKKGLFELDSKFLNHLKSEFPLNLEINDAKRLKFILEKLQDLRENSGEIKEVRCQGVCRNGSRCLNKAHFGKFCSRHSVLG